MARYLVTGGAGFIGSHIVETLVERGDDVRVLDNLSTGKMENLAAIAGRIELVEGDIRDLETCRRAVEGVEAVFHQAALASVARSVEDPLLTNAINVTGTLNLLVAARAAGVRSFVLASSSSVYGDDPTLPKVEGREGQAALALRREQARRREVRPGLPHPLRHERRSPCAISTSSGRARTRSPSIPPSSRCSSPRSSGASARRSSATASSPGISSTSTTSSRPTSWPPRPRPRPARPSTSPAATG